MWALVMFDLPMMTKRHRMEYALFRKMLLKDGYLRIQFSVYARPCPSKENVDVHIQRVERSLPPDGHVRILELTDKQFERMRVFWGKRRAMPEPPPCQLELF